MSLLSLPSRMSGPRSWAAVGSILTLAAAALLEPRTAFGANGDLLHTSTTLWNTDQGGPELGGLCADADGSYWALGEANGKIYHLDATLAKIGEITNPHGTGVFPNLIRSRGIAYKTSTETLLVLATNGALFQVKEVDLTGVEVPEGAFEVHLTTDPDLVNPNLFGLVYDPTLNLLWTVDDTSDQVLRVGMTGNVLFKTLFPGDQQPGVPMQGTGITFRRDGTTPYLYITMGDIFTRAPSRILEMTIMGVPTGIEVPLGKVPSSDLVDPTRPVQQIGAIVIGSFAGSDAVLVVGEKGSIHVLAYVKPDPIPPQFFTAHLTLDNKVNLTWVNRGSTAGGAYLGGISLARDGMPLATLPGTRTDYTDAAPPRSGVVTYTIKGSNGVIFSVAVKVDLLVGSGGLVRWIPFPGKEPFDIARDPSTGQIFITDVVGGKIVRLDGDLNVLGDFSYPNPYPHPGGIAFNPARKIEIPGSSTVTTSTLLVIDADFPKMREFDLTGTEVDAQTPISFDGIPSPRICGLVCDPETSNYTCVETTSQKLITFDRNSQVKSSCAPVDIFTKKLGEGIGMDPFTRNLHAVFEDDIVRELYASSCSPTNQSAFGLTALGQITSLENHVRGIEVMDNTLLVASPGANAIFQLLISPRGQTFIRGDLDQDGFDTLTDAVRIAEYLFMSGQVPFCLDAADTNDDGILDISDPVYLLFHLFLSGPPPPPPYPQQGNDPTYLDNLEC